MLTSDIPREIEDLLVDIKYIAGLPPGRKYDLDSENYTHATSLLSRVYRTIFRTKDKDKALDFINKTITNAVLLARRYPQWQPLIGQEITRLGAAITNLKHVYSGQPKFVDRLATAEIKIGPEAFMNACSQN